MFSNETGAVENIKVIRIATLENHLHQHIDDIIALDNPDGEPVVIRTQTEIWIGEIDYEPIKWQCPECHRWNYQLQYCDPAGAMAICDYCHVDGEF